MFARFLFLNKKHNRHPWRHSFYIKHLAYYSPALVVLLLGNIMLGRLHHIYLVSGTNSLAFLKKKKFSHLQNGGNIQKEPICIILFIIRKETNYDIQIFTDCRLIYRKILIPLYKVCKRNKNFK